MVNVIRYSNTQKVKKNAVYYDKTQHIINKECFFNLLCFSDLILEARKRLHKTLFLMTKHNK